MWRENITRVQKYGFSGMICSPTDLAIVKPLAQDMITVCPGIGSNKGQVRAVTPRQANNLGADYLVIGRTITESDDPIRTIREIRENARY